MSEPLTHARFADDPILQQIAAGNGQLKRGSSGPSVETIQIALLNMGFNLRRYEMGGKFRGGPDGAFGPQSEAALKNFQAHAARFSPDVKIDGVLDAATMRALDALAPDPEQYAWSPGQRCQLPAPFWGGDARRPLRVVVVKQEHRTFLFKKDGSIDRILPNATGQVGTATDPGLKVIAGKLNEQDARSVGMKLWSDPTAFGVRIVNLSWADGRSSGEELHGTNRPDQMGMNVSHGCVRHYNEDIVYLFDKVGMRELVAIVEWIDDPRLGRPASSGVGVA